MNARGNKKLTRLSLSPLCLEQPGWAVSLLAFEWEIQLPMSQRQPPPAVWSTYCPVGDPHISTKLPNPLRTLLQGWRASSPGF